MNSNAHDYDQAKYLTSVSLRKLVDTTEQLTYLSLPERTALVDEISRVVPAGNVPGLVTAGLANLPGRIVPVTESRRNIGLLMQGMQTFMDEAAFKAFFVGPAVVLSAYQMMLKLAGKDLDQSFPEGTWQFYVEFGLREDSARHACESSGFQAALQRENIKLSSTDELAAWVLATIWLLDNYSALLTNEWIERVRIRHLSSFLGEPGLLNRWMKSRPYGVPGGASLDFVEYRRNAFEVFCRDVLEKGNARITRRIEDMWNNKRIVAEREVRLEAYIKQMSIWAKLDATEYSDNRVPLDRRELCVAVISNGRYYLIDIGRPQPPEEIQALCAAILKDKSSTPPAGLDRALCVTHRREQPSLRRMLPAEAQSELARLGKAPVLLNWDLSQSDESLAEIRSGRRGVGDHAFTVFRCSNSTAFDMSHIFFDGAWGMAVAEMLTNQAIRVARSLKPAQRDSVPAVTCLKMQVPAEVASQARKVQLAPEVGAETTLLKLDPLHQLRRTLLARNEKLQLTINDILMMYRALFGQIYQPTSELTRELAELEKSSDSRTRQAVELANTSLKNARQANPALLIPMDASAIDPRERVYPMTFRNPFNDLLTQHRRTLNALENLESARFLGKAVAQRAFEEARRDYLGMIYAFGQVITKYKDVSMKGESVSTSTIKLLGGLPGKVQRLLDSLPDRFDVINDVVKGQEVFSNVGQVAELSSLVRFNTARDDNEKKWLAWGVMTDAKGVVHISLRDFRPHVAAMIAIKRQDLAQKMTQEYIDAYALGLNVFVEEFLRITRTRRQAE